MDENTLLFALPTTMGIGLGLGWLTTGFYGALLCAATCGWATIVLSNRDVLDPGHVAIAVVLCWWLSALCVFDLSTRRLPNLLTVPGALISTGALVAAGYPRPALVGAAILTTVYLIIHLTMPAGLGGGDVKLAWSVGALTGAAGPAAWTHAALLAPTLTAAAATAVCLTGRSDRRIPHGPSMCVATLLVLSISRP